MLMWNAILTWIFARKKIIAIHTQRCVSVCVWAWVENVQTLWVVLPAECRVSSQVTGLQWSRAEPHICLIKHCWVRLGFAWSGMKVWVLRTQKTMKYQGVLCFPYMISVIVCTLFMDISKDENRSFAVVSRWVQNAGDKLYADAYVWKKLRFCHTWYLRW